jgi:hypothetical protein
MNKKITPKNTKFDYDWVFGTQSTQQSIYESVASPLINNIFSGFNGTIFAYGQTGSGKTFTMGGSDGIVFTAIEEIFKKAKELTDADPMTTVSLQLSYLEIYKEECFDLLTASPALDQNTNTVNNTTISSKQPRTALHLRELQGSTVVEGLSTWAIQTPAEAFKLLNKASESRSTNKTAMNSTSSRSHSLCTLLLRVHKASENATVISKLHLVDLAGSERAKKTMATGDIFDEVSNAPYN